MRTEIVDAESLSDGERILAPNGKTWRVIGEPEEAGELITITLAREDEEAPKHLQATLGTRTVHRTTKYEVFCA
jgi:folate-binding Fe-S cluster repair protein YgfZ